jgi:hypothetical protein
MYAEIDKSNIIIAVHSYEPSVLQGILINNELITTNDLGRVYNKKKKVVEDISLTPEQIAKEVQDSINQEQSLYLASTDYVVTKISEASVLGTSEDVHDLITKYADILEKRKTARSLIV